MSARDTGYGPALAARPMVARQQPALHLNGKDLNLLGSCGVISPPMYQPFRHSRELATSVTHALTSATAPSSESATPADSAARLKSSVQCE